MEGLKVLKDEQEDLDLWYEMEKVKLAERYDRMRLSNIQKQKSIIESSHDLLMTTSEDNHNATPYKSLSRQPSVLEHSDLHEVKSPEPSDMHQYESISSANKSLQINNTPLRNSPMNRMPHNQQSEISSEDNTSSNVSRNCNHPVQYSKKLTFQDQNINHQPTSHNSDNSDLRNDNNTEISVEPTVSLASSTEHSLNKLSRSKDNALTDDVPESVKTLGTEFVMRFHQSMDAKLRRKSRATKFFPTPESQTKTSRQIQSPIADYSVENFQSSPCVLEGGIGASGGSVFDTPKRNMESLPYLDKQDCSNSSTDTPNANSNNEGQKHDRFHPVSSTETSTQQQQQQHQAVESLQCALSSPQREISNPNKESTVRSIAATDSNVIHLLIHLFLS